MPPVELDFGWATQGPEVDVDPASHQLRRFGEPRERTNPLTDLGLGATLGRFKAVRSVDLSDCKRIADTGLATIGEGCPDLVSLNLTR